VKGKRNVRSKLWSVSAVVLAVLAFKLFEPGFVWIYGWQRMPTTAYPSVSVSSDGWSDTATQAGAWLLAARAQLDAPALSAAVSVDGRRAWAGAVGYADITAGRAATLETTFRIGSTSKAVTSIAMGTLIDRNAIDLDAPISRYIPDLSAPLASVTTRQAMSHTAGVRNYALCVCFPIWESLSRRHYDGPQREVLRPYERDALLFSPGQSFAYTSLGYNVAGAVIEHISQVRFAEFLERAVTGPLGLVATRTDAGQPGPGDARFYDVEDHQYKEAFRVDNTNKLPSGGILSTPSDLVRLGAQMIEPTLFSRQTRDLLAKPQPVADGRANPQGYALGWRYQGDSASGTATTRRLHHHGTAQGSTSHFTLYPAYGMAVSVVMNKGQAEARTLGQQADRLAELFATAIDGQKQELW
jgi:CubicO group peptidase (beta-lactamase class C family)